MLPAVLQGRAKDHAVRKGVKAFSDALLDLLVGTEETRRYVKDLWGKQELLYLGPDEQVSHRRNGGGGGGTVWSGLSR